VTVVLTQDFALDGVEVGLDQAEAIKSQGVRLISAGPGPFTVNLSSLQRANSVTVALLLAWYRFAALQQKSIVFTHLSQDLRNIIEFSGLSQILLPNSPGQVDKTSDPDTPS
jgi:ABC-type transporter Mla MlaB component